MPDDCQLSSDDSRQRRVVHLPVYPENPYQPMIMAAQRDLGWEVIDGGGGGNFLRTALTDWRADVLHVHWLHPYLLRKSRVGSWLRGLRFLAEIALLRRLGTRIVWTVHNLGNHDRRHADIELSLTRRFVRLCDLVITHGEFASITARERFRIPLRIPVLAVRHPNYCEQNRSDLSASQSRACLGLRKDDFVIVFIGRVEPYKQVVELAQAFRDCASDQHRLLIRGRASSVEYARQVESVVSNDSRIEFHNEFVSDEHVALLLKASDVVACPSIGILTSGSVSLAMSFGRPVIAPAEGCIPEEVGTAGVLYDPQTPNGLQQAMKQAFANREELSVLGDAALQRAEEASPARVATALTSLYDTYQETLIHFEP